MVYTNNPLLIVIYEPHESNFEKRKLALKPASDVTPVSIIHAESRKDLEVLVKSEPRLIVGPSLALPPLYVAGLPKLKPNGAQMSIAIVGPLSLKGGYQLPNVGYFEDSPGGGIELGIFAKMACVSTRKK